MMTKWVFVSQVGDASWPGSGPPGDTLKIRTNAELFSKGEANAAPCPQCNE